mmetsp:Transcript_5047/g.11242  ORF Transcript_5047/g.11242 Transcript_5047/m.11242 type:complete len:87 (+) Transcript_5047:622-882(+)
MPWHQGDEKEELSRQQIQTHTNTHTQVDGVSTLASGPAYNADIHITTTQLSYAILRDGTIESLIGNQSGFSHLYMKPTDIVYYRLT